MDDMIIIASDDEAPISGDTKNKKIDTPGAPRKSFMDTVGEYLTTFQSVKTKDKVVMYRLLAVMINAGMPLVQAFGVLEKQEKNKTLKKIFSEVMIGLKEGRNLSECLDDFPKSFANAEIGVIRSGEKTGKLNEIMSSLADQVEKVASVTGKLKSALIYPAMIMLVVAGVIGIMMTVVVPKLLEIFDSSESLPTSTQILIFISNFLTSYWYLIIIGAMLLVAGVKHWKKTESGKYNYDQLTLKVPVVGSIVEKVVLSKFSRVFAGLLSSGVSIVESLKIVSDAVGNEVYRQRILLMLDDVRKGLKIYEAIEGDPLFPDIMVQMIQVGEQTANLDKTIIKVADFYDEQVDNMAATINKLLEPFIIVFLAVVVGFIAIAIMQPIMNLADTVSQS